METTVERIPLASYVPTLVAHYLAGVGTAEEPLTAVCPGAVMFADISGFTALTEQLAQEGPAGAEKLTIILNDYFGRLVDTIQEHGGDVFKFAGDALFVVWPVLPEGDLSTAVLRACQAALAIQSRLQDYQGNLPSGEQLALRIAIGAGDLTFFHLGGMYGRWEYLVAGEPLNQINEAETQAQVQEVVLSARARRLAGGVIRGDLLQAGALRLTSLTWSEPPAPLALDVPNTAVVNQLLSGYVPGAINFRITAGQSSWLAEMRSLTILFINLPDLTHKTPLVLAQQMVLTLQQHLYRYEGSVNKISVDEKGATMVAAFGLPPMAHEDDAVRGSLAALNIVPALRELGVRVKIGVTTGRVFCGLVGTETRREYTMIGNAANLSARLMQLAGTLPQLVSPILCDAATEAASRQRITYEAHPAVSLKGKAVPVVPYEPRRPHTAVSLQFLPSQSEAIGRFAEKSVILHHLFQLQRGQNSFCLMQGEGGIGKSNLVEYAQAQAAQIGLTSFVATADAVERITPYYAWRTVFAQIFDLSIFAQMENLPAAQDHLLNLLADTDDPELVQYAPLLNPVLPFNLPENEFTRPMGEEARARRTENFLLRVLHYSVTLSPKFLVVEDAHWLDDTSWSFLVTVQREIQPLMILVSTRPLAHPPRQYETLLALPDLVQISLEGMSKEDSHLLICQELAVEVLPEQVTQLIWEKAEGHPFYTTQLACNLRDAGHLLIDSETKTARLAQNIQLTQIALPDTLRAAIISRIDRLNAQQAMTLKVASVIGRVFAYQILDSIYPIVSDRPNLPDHLFRLRQLDLTLLEDSAPQLSYLFKHIITQEVAYELMSYNQRRQLHCTLAEWYELAFAADLAQVAPLLGHHWQLGDEPEKAMGYYVQAAELAMQSFANREAIDFYQAALQMYGNLPTAVAESWQTSALAWQAELALAYYNLGLFAQTETTTQAILHQLGQPMPRTPGQLRRRLLRQVVRQLAHRALPKLFFGRARSEEEQTRLTTAVRAYSRLGSTYYFTNQTQQFLYTILCALNAAEKAGLHRDLPITYAIAALMATMTGRHRLAQTYANLARHTSQQIPDLSMQAFVLSRISLTKLSVGQLAEVMALSQEAVVVYTRLGDERQRNIAHSLVSAIDYLQGRFNDAVVLGVALAQASVQIQDFASAVWRLVTVCEALLALGEWAQVQERLQEAEGWLQQTRGYDYAGLQVLWLTWYAHAGDWEAVRTGREGLVDRFIQGVGTSESFARMVVRFASVLLWEAELAWRATETIPPALQAEIEQVLAHLERMVKRFVLVWGDWAWCSGWLAWLEGNHGRARRLWQKGIEAGMKLERWPLVIQLHHTAGRLGQEQDTAVCHSHQRAINHLQPLTQWPANRLTIPTDPTQRIIIY